MAQRCGKEQTKGWANEIYDVYLHSPKEEIMNILPGRTNRSSTSRWSQRVLMSPLEGQCTSFISTRQNFLQIADYPVLSLCKSTWMTWVDLPLLHPGSSEEALRGVRVSLKGLVGPPGGENSQFAYNGWVGVFAPHFAASLVILPPRRRQCYPTDTARLIYALRDARLRPSRSWRRASGLPRVLNWWIGWRAFPAHLGKRWY